MKKEKGFSLIELLIVISVIIGIAVGVFYIYKKASFGIKTNETIKELTSIANQITNIAESSGFDTYNKSYPKYQNTPYFPFELIETGLQQIEKPKWEGVNSIYFKSPFGGNFGISLITYNDIFNSVSYTIEMHEFDVESCAKIMNSQLDNVYGKNLIQIQAGYGNMLMSENLIRTDEKGNILQEKSTLRKEIANACSKNESEKGIKKLRFIYNYK